MTGVRLTSHYRVLEKTGRKDHQAGEELSPRTVRYLHTIIHRVLRQKVRDGLLPRNPADSATPPTAREARPPEMRCWSAAQLAEFLGWERENSPPHEEPPPAYLDEPGVGHGLESHGETC